MGISDLFGGIWIKIIAGLLCAGVLMGAWMYVSGLRSDLAIEKANNAVLQGDVDAFKMAGKFKDESINRLQEINLDLSLRNNVLNLGEVNFAKDLGTKTSGYVAALTKSLDDPAVRKQIENAINSETALNLRCTEIATAAPTPDDLKDEGLKAMCPELLGVSK